MIYASTPGEAVNNKHVKSLKVKGRISAAPLNAYLSLGIVTKGTYPLLILGLTWE